VLSCIAAVSGSLDARAREADWMEPGGCRAGEVVTRFSSVSASSQRWRVSNRHSCDLKTSQPAENKRPNVRPNRHFKGCFQHVFRAGSVCSLPVSIFEFPFSAFPDRHFTQSEIASKSLQTRHILVFRSTVFWPYRLSICLSLPSTRNWRVSG